MPCQPKHVRNILSCSRSFTGPWQLPVCASCCSDPGLECSGIFFRIASSQNAHSNIAKMSLKSSVSYMVHVTLVLGVFCIIVLIDRFSSDLVPEEIQDVAL